MKLTYDCTQIDPRMYFPKLTSTQHTIALLSYGSKVHNNQQQKFLNHV